MSKEPAIEMLLWCPSCGIRHIDVGEFRSKLHHTHACQGCGMVWRPAVVNTVGVAFLPGFKNGEEKPQEPVAKTDMEETKKLLFSSRKVEEAVAMVADL